MEHNITTKFEKGITPLTSEEIEYIKELYVGGMSYYQIGKKFGYEPNRIRHHLKTSGLLNPGRDRLKRLLSPEQVEVVSLMRYNGLSWDDIEKQIGIPKATLSHYVRNPKHA